MALFGYFIIIYLSLTANAGNDYFIELNNKAYLNGCNSIISPKSIFTWSFVEKPNLSNLDENDIITQANDVLNYTCLAYFYPDTPGKYIIKLEVNNGLKSEDTIEITVLNKIEYNKINLKYFYKNTFYNENMNYILNYNNQKAFLPLRNKEKQFLCNSLEGIFYIKNINQNKNYLNKTNSPFYIKENEVFDLYFYSENYQSFTQKNINSSNVSKIDIPEFKITSNFAVEFEQNSQKIKGIFNYYLKNGQILSTLKNNYDKNLINKVIFTPLKALHNLPNVEFSGNLTGDIVYKYKNFNYHNLTVDILDNSTYKIDILGKNIKNCLENQQNINCIYEKTLFLTESKQIELIEGEYVVKVSKKNHKSKEFFINLNENETILLNSFEKNKLISVNLPENIKTIVFKSNTNNYFFKKGDIIEIEEDIYDIYFFTEKGFGFLPFEHIKENYENNFKTLTLIINTQENNETVNDGFLFLNDYYYIRNYSGITEADIPFLK